MTRIQKTFAQTLTRLAVLPEAKNVLTAFLDVATTSHGRATHYNTREEQQAAEIAAHDQLLHLDRDVYAAFLTLPGLSDRSVQVGTRNLLACSSGEDRILDPATERRLIAELMRKLPITRALKVMQSFRLGNRGQGIYKANNARSRKVILGTLLGSRQLELWAVKYRNKMRECLMHAWGVRLTGILRSILARAPGELSDKERSIVGRSVLAHTVVSDAVALECVAFILRSERAFALPLLRAFEDAKSDLSAGKRLPLEVLEGIRSTYHKDVPSESLIEVIEVDSMSAGQKMAVQRKAADKDVEVELDFRKYDAVRLYLYAFEMGLSAEIERELDAKALRAASKFPFDYGRAGILIDTSASMAGGDTQPLRPMATALATRDVLDAAMPGCIINTTCGRDNARLLRPGGDTSLARGLVELLGSRPDAVFVLSDGYENRSAGRFAEVVDAVRDIGIDTPIYHLNPVMSAEAAGARSLVSSDDTVATIPIARVDGFGTSMLREALRTDPAFALRKLFDLTRVPKA